MLKRALSVVALITLGAGCTAPATDDGFGTPKPVKNDGMVHKPGPLPDAPPDWGSALAVVPAYDQATKTLTVVLKITEGFHAYGPGEEISKPITMSMKPDGGWAFDGDVTIPAGKKKDLGDLGTSVILEGNVAMTAKLKPGTGAIEGIVEAMVCTDKACDRPRKHPFTIPAA